ncbi:DUF4265 domain-containing protein [Streptomyces venezuelae ATCC 10712]|nr:DUF4265 domain-containing protein [Streptomyces venezuelae ATCC 10712]
MAPCDSTTLLGSYAAWRAETSSPPTPTRTAFTGRARWYRRRRTPIRLLVLCDKGSSAARQSVLNAFAELGVGGEGIERFGMVALDVPPEVDLAKVQRLLDHGVAQEWWDMEEGCITDAWRTARTR